uniref:ubiquitinyl hydrolase 1 n=1 Tax=Amphilophus citrinellus TaxID=61819 RepID=A0A3Q0RN04_AMPCI
MSGAHEQIRKRRPPKTFLISTDVNLRDQLEGTIPLQRGFICQEQDPGRRGDNPWVKVLDNDFMVKIDRRLLVDVPSDLTGLLEAVSDPEARLKLLSKKQMLEIFTQLASLPSDSPLWVKIGQQDDLAEAELKYIGPLTRGSSAVYFGVQLKGSAVGKGQSNGTYKGQRLFTCPDACALFVPASHIRPRQWSSNSDGHERARERDSSQLSPFSVLSRTAESAPITAHNQVQGQRVCCHQNDRVSTGEVAYFGPLPGRGPSGMYVGVILDTPDGNWDGNYNGEKLCHVPSNLYGALLSANKVSLETSNFFPSASSEPKSHHQNLTHKISKAVLKPALPPVTKSVPISPPASAPKIALMPPIKPALKSPPLPPPKPTQKSVLPAPLPPPKPQTTPTVATQPQHTNGTHGPASPLRVTDHGDNAAENGEAGPGSNLEVGSMVEVNDPPLFGVIRWIGWIKGISEPVAGIELDQELSAGTDGSYLGERHFRCPANKGLFVKLRNCRRDSRFPAPEMPVNQVERCNSIAFAEWGSERVEDHTPPIEGDEARELYQGWKKGIQGHLNSCYLDATLFSLFSCCSSADCVLFWPTDPETDQSSSQAQDLLRCDIVNPLRRYGYVCASKTMALRRLLEAANSDTGFTNQEKDPEEFLNKLFQLLRVEPLLKIRSMSQQPQECHLYQLFPPPLPTSPTSPQSLSPVNSPIPLSSASSMRVASVQTLLESSFLHSGLKFVEAPSCLLLLMPRFGKDFKMFDAILPTLSLDITDLLDDTLRQCSICQAVAEWECLQCYDDPDITPGHLKQYCQTCNIQVHSHRKRASHSPVQIGVPGGQWTGPLHCTRQRMSLFAVTCIETSHYVSFVKHGPLNTDWLFFDSMADREGGENGFNIPQVKACPEVGRYLSLSEEELSRVDPASLREATRRLLCDSYMCLYHSPELSLYK